MLITRSEESCWTCMSNLCDLGNSTSRRPGPEVGCCATEKILVVNLVDQCNYALCEQQRD